MSSVARKIPRDGVVHVRSGAISRMGPSGPPGASGPRGLPGPMGPQGVPGPTGEVSLALTKVHNYNDPRIVPTGLAFHTVSFPNVVSDELGMLINVTQLKPPPGVWVYNMLANFYKPSGKAGAGSRIVRVIKNGSSDYERGKVSAPACADMDTIVNTHFVVDNRQEEVAISFAVRHTDTVSISVDMLVTVFQLGPGPQGPPGPAGDVGAQGIPGPQGPIGPAGSLVTSNTTYADIGG